MDAQDWVKDSDGTYWLALYQVCVHLGCKVPFRDDCNSFKCPCHGSHYNIDGEYLDGPAPRSLDRFVSPLIAAVMSSWIPASSTSMSSGPMLRTRLLRVPYVAVCAAS